MLYQVGNSTLHLEHLRQLRQYSGAIVLHDFYLSHGLCHQDADPVLGDDAMLRLYRSHGFQAVALFQRDRLEDKDRAIWRYPCNLQPLQAAAGVIVHSQEAIDLAQGDSATIRSTGRRTYRNTGDVTARILGVIARPDGA